MKLTELKPYRVIPDGEFWGAYAVIDAKGSVYMRYQSQHEANRTANALNNSDGSIGNWNRSQITKGK